MVNGFLGTVVVALTKPGADVDSLGGAEHPARPNAVPVRTNRHPIGAPNDR